MGVEQCQLLAAVDGIRGIVVEHDALGHALEAVAKQIDHRSPMRASSRHDGAFSSLDKVGCDIRSSTALGQPTTGQLERRIEAQHVEVVAILVSAGDGEHARPDHVGV